MQGPAQLQEAARNRSQDLGDDEDQFALNASALSASALVRAGSVLQADASGEFQGTSSVLPSPDPTAPPAAGVADIDEDVSGQQLQ